MWSIVIWAWFEDHCVRVHVCKIWTIIFSTLIKTCTFLYILLTQACRQRVIVVGLCVSYAIGTRVLHVSASLLLFRAY